jgi:hypothetical protein
MHPMQFRRGPPPPPHMQVHDMPPQMMPRMEPARVERPVDDDEAIELGGSSPAAGGQSNHDANNEERRLQDVSG